MQALRPYPQYVGVQTWQDGGDRSGNSSYHALVVQVRKRYSAGLELLGSYVFSKFLGDADAAAAATGGTPTAMDHYNRRLEKTLSRRDQTHIAKLNYSYELPFGRGRRFANRGPLSRLVGGWRIAAIHNYFSGTPMSVSPGYGLPLGGGPNRVTVSDYDGWRAPISGDKFDPFVDTWWDRSAFARVQPDCSIPSGVKVGVPCDKFGSATVRNPKARGPSLLNENVSISRTFQFTESFRMDLRWEMFNIFNRVAWGGPDSRVSSDDFGLVRSQGNLPRQMQFALKFVF